MRSRLLGAFLVALLAALLAVPAAAGPAAAEEEEELEQDHEVEPLPSLDEVGTGTEVAEQFYPESPEEAPFTDALVFPLVGAALLLALVVLLLYLRWLPKFVREKQQAGRR